MKKNIATVTLLAALGYAQAASATNWLELQNNEQAGAKPYTFWGFVQPTYTYNQGDAVNGITAPPGLTPYNDHTALFNLVAPDNTNKDKLQLLRARGGVRGVIPGTDEKINYFTLVEVGNNGLTREKSAVFTDATISFNYIPGARIRAGLGRLPLGEEAMQGIQVFDYINFSNVTDNLLNERFVVPYSTTRPTSPALGVPLASSKVEGAVGGFRDVGVEIYDWFKRDKWEHAYAVMLSQGTGIDFSNDANSGNHDVSVRLQTAYVFGGAGPKRDDAMFYVWHQEGQRKFNGNDYSRVREGIGAKYLRGNLRASGEYIRGRGMIFIGANPPFNDVGGATAFEPVTLVALADTNKADGYYVDLGWKITPKWEVDVRYDQLNRLTNSAFDEREFTTWTLGPQYFFTPKLRLAMNYEIRKLKVENPDAKGQTGTAIAQQTQLKDAGIIASSMGNRISAQLTWSF